MSFQKLFLGFLLAITIAIVNVLYSTQTVVVNQRQIEDMTNKVYPYIDELKEFDRIITKSKMLVTNWVYLPYSLDDKASLKALHQKTYPKLKKSLVSALEEQLIQTDKGALTSLLNSFEELLAIEQEIMGSLPDMQAYEDPATMFDAEEVIEMEVLPRTNDLQQKLDGIIYTNLAKAQAQKEAMLVSLESLRHLVLGLGLVLVLIMVASYFYIQSKITKPVVAMRDHLLSLSQGKLPIITTNDSQTIIGKMNLALNKLVENFKMTAQFADEVGQGNYDAKHQLLSAEDVLGNALLQMRGKLKDYSQNLEQKIEERTLQLQEKQQELEIKNQALTASEEEIRQSAEELRAVNEHLGAAKERLEVVFEKEQEQNQKLAEALNELQTTQSQLVQAEKMSSLGQLTAGIAHEINNPINFVYAGANTLKTIVDDMCKVLNNYGELNSTMGYEDITKHLDALKIYKEEVYFDELEEDMRALVSDIILGAERTQIIVQSLKTFSRLDEDGFKQVDLIENIESTLTILKSQLGDDITVVKEYGQGDFFVECNIGEINQVFMNLITNASQAIDGKGEIKIKMWEADKQCFVQIKDSGSGMDEETLKHIFDPFFTTKDVGKGTGLGLSITHGIIEKHGGSIKVESGLGKGTTFTISLYSESAKYTTTSKD